MTHRYHRGVHETNAAALPEALKFQEEHQVEEHAWHEFHKTVVRNSIRKTAGKIPLYTKEVVMFEIGKRAEVITHKDSIMWRLFLPNYTLHGGRICRKCTLNR